MVRFGAKAVLEAANGKSEVMDVGWGTSSWRADRDTVHEPSRLRIMAAVLRTGGIGFQDLRVQLALEDAELAAHTKRLEAAGMLETRREIGGTGVVVTFQATQKGRSVMTAYRDWMREIISGL